MLHHEHEAEQQHRAALKQYARHHQSVGIFLVRLAALGHQDDAGDQNAQGRECEEYQDVNHA